MERGENKETMTSSFNLLLIVKHSLMLKEYRKVNLMCQDGIVDEILEISFFLHRRETIAPIINPLRKSPANTRKKKKV